MTKYEVFILPAYSGQDIEADSAEDAKRIFVEMVRDHLDVDNVEANNLDTENGLDPT